MVTRGARDPAAATAGNANTTFSTSAQRSVKSLILATTAVPPYALALPALLSLFITPPTPSQRPQLTAGSFGGMAALQCINCGRTFGVANLTGFRLGDLLTSPLSLPLITSLDTSATGITAVEEHAFDGLSAVQWVSLARNNLTYVSDGAFSGAKQPVLAGVDQTGNPLTTGAGCRRGTYLRVQYLPASWAPVAVCSACAAGHVCPGGSGVPEPCGANTFSNGDATACTPCAAGSYAAGNPATECVACQPGVAAPACNASATWRDTITVVSDGAGSWVGASIYLVPAGGGANVSCGAVAAVSPNAVSCALPFLLPGVATAPVLTQLWVVHLVVPPRCRPLRPAVLAAALPSASPSRG